MSEYEENEMDTHTTLMEINKHTKLMEINKHHLTTLMEINKPKKLMEISKQRRTILEPGDYVYMRDSMGYNRGWTQKGLIIELKEAQYAIRVLGSYKIVLKNRENLRKSILLGNQ